MMTKADLRQFKAIQRHLDEKQAVQSLHIRAAEYHSPALTHGGPVFMSVGQVIQLDVVGESRRLLEGEAESGTDPAAADSQPPAGDQSAPAATNATESAPEGPSVKAAT